MPPLVEIGVTDLPKSERGTSPRPAPLVATALTAAAAASKTSPPSAFGFSAMDEERARARTLEATLCLIKVDTRCICRLGCTTSQKRFTYSTFDLDLGFFFPKTLFLLDQFEPLTCIDNAKKLIQNAIYTSESSI